MCIPMVIVDWRFRHNPVEDAGVGVEDLLRIVASLPERILSVRIAHQRERHIVYLDVPTTKLMQRLDLRNPDLDRIIPELG